MTELVDLKCPNCAAPLKQGQAACDYCGHNFLVKSEPVGEGEAIYREFSELHARQQQQQDDILDARALKLGDASPQQSRPIWPILLPGTLLVLLSYLLPFKASSFNVLTLTIPFLAIPGIVYIVVVALAEIGNGGDQEDGEEES